MSVQFEEFARRDCDILGISTDSLESHERWLTTPRSQGGIGRLAFPLASDLEGAVCQTYGVYLPRQNIALRGLFIIDVNGVLQYQVVHNLSVGRRSEEVLRVLDGLQTGGLCPENWVRDDPVINPAWVIGPSSVVGQYRVDEQIGTGSFGVVFRGHDLTLERPVALKIFHRESNGSPRRALDEARSAAALNHPNVCTIFAIDESDGVSMIVMEYIDGNSLKKVLSGGKLSLEEAKNIARQIALGMAAAHAQQIVHGDLKPGNIMVTSDGLAKIMDFGLAHREPRATDETGTWDTISEAGGLSGTPDYMSPEQTRGEPASSRSDVFALALMLYEMVSGRKAVTTGNLLDVLRQIDTLDAARFAEGMPEPLATILRRALVGDPRQRDITMSDIVELLDWRDFSIAGG